VGKVTAMNQDDEDLAEAFRRMPWSAILIPLAVGLVVVAATLIIVLTGN
jgi:hypothetical protein